MSTGIRHTVAMRTRAREHAAAEWSHSEIVRLLEREFGRRVSRSTVRLWVDDAAAERQRDHQRRFSRDRARNSSGRLGGGFWAATREFKMTRVRALDEARISAGSIARLMGLDFGDDISEDQVRYALRTDRYPERPPRRRG